MINMTFLQVIYEKLVLDNDNNFSLISLTILITCLLDNVWMGECMN